MKPRKANNILPDGLRNLPYVGGKSAAAGPGQWIHKALENIQCKRYIEPFSGMLGMLLRRQPVPFELVNDKSSHIFNFWRVIRDEPKAFAGRLSLTPFRSREQYTLARADLNSNDPVTRAVAVFVLLISGMPSSLNERAHYTPATSNVRWDLPEDVTRLSQRMINVKIENKCGLEILDKYGGKEDALIYVDPPYPGKLSYPDTVDAQALVKLLLQAKAKVAVSGYSDSWPELEDRGIPYRQKKAAPFITKVNNNTERLYLLNCGQDGLLDAPEPSQTLPASDVGGELTISKQAIRDGQELEARLHGGLSI